MHSATLIDVDSSNEAILELAGHAVLIDTDYEDDEIYFSVEQSRKVHYMYFNNPKGMIVEATSDFIQVMKQDTVYSITINEITDEIISVTRDEKVIYES